MKLIIHSRFLNFLQKNSRISSTEIKTVGISSAVAEVLKKWILGSFLYYKSRPQQTWL